MIEKDLWDILAKKSYSIESGMDSLHRKRTGSYYTDLSLTDVMMDELVESMQAKKDDVLRYKFFEPCVGAGNFVFSYIKKNTRKIRLNTK